MLYPVNGFNHSTTKLEWYLETKKRASPKLNLSDPKVIAFPRVFLKNGYIYDNTLYLSAFDYLEVYELSYPLGEKNIEQMKIKFLKKLESQHVISCLKQDSQNEQFFITMYVSLFYLFAVIAMALLVVASKTNMKGVKFVLGANCTMIELSEDLIFNCK